MKHRNSFRKLGRTSSHRWALLRNLVTELIRHERIETTLPKAKELRRVADNMISLGKEGTLAARRQAAGVVHGDEILHKLFTELSVRYQPRSGGYTRVLATRIRQGDAAPLAYIEYVSLSYCSGRLLPSCAILLWLLDLRVFHLSMQL
jgi:large subunit ribosomal protein L17